MGDYIRSPLMKRYEYEDHSSVNFCQLNEKIFACRWPQKGVWETLFLTLLCGELQKEERVFFI